MSPSATEAPRIGQPAPDFTLPSTAERDFTLSALQGRSHVVLAFFPLAFTSVCTAEMCSFTEDFSQFASAGTVVAGISVDSIPTLKEFRAKHGITVDLVSDFKRVVARMYGTLDEAKFQSRRAYFIVDRAGLLRWSFTERENGHRRENRELLAELAKLR